MTKLYVSDGPCPFLLCQEQATHAHPVCPSCGAVRYGNLFCRTCNVERLEFTLRGDLAVLVSDDGERGPMSTFLAQPSALSASALSGGDTLGVDAARAGSPVQSSPAASPRPGSPESEATDPRAPERRLVTTAAGGQTARAVFVRRPEGWRLRGRPYDPQQRALSRGEQRVQMADRLVYGTSGVLVGLMVLYLVVGAVWR